MTRAQLYTFTRSEELMDRALKVIPSGIYGAQESHDAYLRLLSHVPDPRRGMPHQGRRRQ